MPIYVTRTESGSTFGYLPDVDVDYLSSYHLTIWAAIDETTWTIRFDDGRDIEYESFDEIHEALYQLMERSPIKRTSVTLLPDGSAQYEEVMDIREQWAELGAEVKAWFQ